MKTIILQSDLIEIKRKILHLEEMKILHGSKFHDWDAGYLSGLKKVVELIEK